MPELENSLPEEPSAKGGFENTTPPQAGVSFFAKFKTKCPIVLGVLGSIAIFVVLIYAVYSYGRHGQGIQPTPSPTAGSTPIVVATPLLTLALTPAVTTPSPIVSAEGKIAFVKDGNIWTIFPDGSGEIQLTEAKTIHGTGAPNPDYVEIPGDVENPDWSPDGSAIVFNDTSDGNIWTATGYTVKKLITSLLANQGATTYSAPKWSPDGQKIAFFVTGDQYSGLTIISKEGNLLKEFIPSDFITARNFHFISQVHAVAAPGLLVDSFVWMKDSKNLLVGVKGNSMDEIRKDTQEIWQVSYGGQRKRLIEDAGHPALSPDGKRIAYSTSSVENDIPRSHLWVYDLDKNEKKKLASVEAFCDSFDNLQFSPDSRKILSLTNGGCGDGNEFHVTDPESGKLYSGGGGFYHSLIWLDNQNIIAVVIRSITQPFVSLEIIDMNGDTVRQLTTNASQPRWQL